MAKKTILVCDWCPSGNEHAVATLALTNGRVTKDTPTLDLCKPHVKKLHRLFKARKSREPKSGERKKWPDAEKRVFAALTNEPTAPIVISRKLKMSQFITAKVLRNLLADKKIKKTGNRRSLRYSR